MKIYLRVSSITCRTLRPLPRLQITLRSSRYIRNKVIRKSRTADRNRTRYCVPSNAASGISTAIFADRVRIPLKGLGSMMGVFPVNESQAISRAREQLERVSAKRNGEEGSPR